MAWLSDDEFETIVDEAIASIPRDLTERIDNISIDIHDEPSADHLRSVECAAGGELLGLYRGVPLPKRDAGYGLGNTPDQIWLFRGPIQRVSHDVETARETVRRTILHEVGHYFGLDDARLRQLGY